MSARTGVSTASLPLDMLKKFSDKWRKKRTSAALATKQLLSQRIFIDTSHMKAHKNFLNYIEIPDSSSDEVDDQKEKNRKAAADDSSDEELPAETTDVGGNLNRKKPKVPAKKRKQKPVNKSVNKQKKDDISTDLGGLKLEDPKNVDETDKKNDEKTEETEKTDDEKTGAAGKTNIEKTDETDEKNDGRTNEVDREDEKADEVSEKGGRIADETDKKDEKGEEVDQKGSENDFHERQGGGSAASRHTNPESGYQSHSQTNSQENIREDSLSSATKYTASDGTGSTMTSPRRLRKGKTGDRRRRKAQTMSGNNLRMHYSLIDTPYIDIPLSSIRYGKMRSTSSSTRTSTSKSPRRSTGISPRRLKGSLYCNKSREPVYCPMCNHMTYDVEHAMKATLRLTYQENSTYYSVKMSEGSKLYSRNLIPKNNVRKR